MNPFKNILIDGDILVYQSSSAVQKDIDWGDGLFTCHAFLEDAQDTFVLSLKSIIKDMTEKGYADDNSKYIFAFSDSTNFRKELNPNYKSNRKNTRKPTCYYALRDSIKELEGIPKITTVTLDNLEGDDTLGVMATSNPYKDSVIVSMDKDFKTLPCYFYNYDKKTLELHLEDFKYWTMFQTLVGDITDGYKGCPNVGKVSAEKILKAVKDPKDYWKVVVETYKSKGSTFEDAVLNYRMAHILTCYDYDMCNKQVIWVPMVDPTTLTIQ